MCAAGAEIHGWRNQVGYQGALGSSVAHALGWVFRGLPPAPPGTRTDNIASLCLSENSANYPLVGV